MEIKIKKQKRDGKWGSIYFYDIYSPSNTLIARVDGGYLNSRSSKTAIIREITEEGFSCDFPDGDFIKKLCLTLKQKKELERLLMKGEPALIWIYRDSHDERLSKAFASKEEAIEYGRTIHPNDVWIHQKVDEILSTI